MAERTVVAPKSAFRYLQQRPWMQYYTLAEDGSFELASGEHFGPITVAYETYGKLSLAKDNVVVISHALTGDSHCASHGEADPEEGWWEPLVGPVRPFDTHKYFVVCANVLGGCQGSTGPSSINSETDKPYAMDFPIVTISDMVRVQRELLRHLGIDHVRAIAGGSMGGMQVLEWGVRYPGFADGIIPIAAPGRSYPQSIGWNEVARQAIMSDPGWNNGQYYDGEGPVKGLGVARMLGMITYQSEESMLMKFGREVMNAGKDALFEWQTQFEVESYLHYQGRKLVRRFDANTYLYLTRALDLFDVGWGYPSYEDALARIQCPTLIIGVNSDILYPCYQQREIVHILREAGTPVQYAEIDTPFGHDGFLIEFPKMVPILEEFLQRLQG